MSLNRIKLVESDASHAEELQLQLRDCQALVNLWQRKCEQFRIELESVDLACYFMKQENQILLTKLREIESLVETNKIVYENSITELRLQLKSSPLSCPLRNEPVTIVSNSINEFSHHRPLVVLSFPLAGTETEIDCTKTDNSHSLPLNIVESSSDSSHIDNSSHIDDKTNVTTCKRKIEQQNVSQILNTIFIIIYK